jgi:hypothetical protein
MTFLSEVLARTSVPLFFIISGCLFFNNFDKIDSNFFKRYRKILYTLIIPYLVWNLISYVVLNNSFDFGISMVKSLILSFGFYSISFSSINLPSDAPIWFVRDIIGLVLVSPLIYFLLKKFCLPTLLLLFVFWFVGKGPIYISGFSSVALFFFTLGAFLSIKKIDINRLIRYRYFLLVFFIIFSILDTITLRLLPASDNMAYHQHYINIIHNVYLLFSSIAFFVWAAFLIKHNISFSFSRIENSAFVILAFPWIILTPINDLCLKLFGVPHIITPLFELVIYISVYVLLVLLSICVYFVISKTRLTRLLFIGKRFN